jgi:hypothetical protein
MTGANGWRRSWTVFRLVRISTPVGNISRHPSIVLISIWFGLYFARKRLRSDDVAPVGTVVNATLGLLAPILAFTFGVTSGRFDSRKQALLDEITAIETTARRADLIPEAHRTEVKDLIRQYIELRIFTAQNSEEVRRAVALSNVMTFDRRNKSVSSMRLSRIRSFTANTFAKTRRTVLVYA